MNLTDLAAGHPVAGTHFSEVRTDPAAAPCNCAGKKRNELASSHCPSQTGEWIVAGQTGRLEVVKLALGNVRFGSKADIPERLLYVSFTPKSGH